MFHRKVSGPIRIRSDGDTPLSYELDPAPGGSRCKVILWSIKVVQKSQNVSVGLKYATGPDGDVFGPAKTPLALTAPGGVPTVLQAASGTPDTNAADVLGEWIRVTLECGVTTGTADEWALVELWETRKPF